MKKKVLSALLLLCLLFSFVLVACDEDDSSGDTSKGSVGLTYKALDDGKTCTVTGIGTCTDTAVKIPEVIDGLEVVAIVASAFSQNAELTSVIVPFGTKTITANAFLACSALSYVVLPATLENIGTSAFRDCDLLSTIYYEGAPSDWTKVKIGGQNDTVTSATILYYSESTPTATGNYWHYVDGVPAKW